MMTINTRRALLLLLLAPSAAALDFDNESIRIAVNAWLDDPESAESIYGPIESWNTWRVTDMSRLFQGAVSFNANLNQWNTAAVTDMHHMFAGCEAFDSPLDQWQVGSVTDFSFAFYGAKSFTGTSLATWETSSAHTMEQMFLGATNFMGNLEDWDVSSVTSMYAMFFQATSFDSPVNKWDMSNVEYTNSLFEGASKFSQKVCWPSMHPLGKCFQCFCGTSDATFDMEATCSAKVHPSIQAYSQACDPDDILEELVASQRFDRPDGNNLVGDLGVSGTMAAGLQGLPGLLALGDDSEAGSRSSVDKNETGAVAEAESNLEVGDRGIDTMDGAVVIAAIQEEASAAPISSGLVVSFLAVLASIAKFC